jgi:hypothetical protein
MLANAKGMFVEPSTTTPLIVICAAMGFIIKNNRNSKVVIFMLEKLFIYFPLHPNTDILAVGK